MKPNKNKNINNSNNDNKGRGGEVGVMSRVAHGGPAFTEHRYSKSPDLCT